MGCVNCPKCGETVSEVTASCPGCGSSITSQVIKKEHARAQPSGGIGTRMSLGAITPISVGAIVVLIVLCKALFNNGSSEISSPSHLQSTTFTPAQKLTHLDRGDVDTTATAQMQERLHRLAMKYGGGNESDVADRLVKAQGHLARNGIRMTLGQIVDSVEAAGPRRHMISIDELLAIYVTTRSENSDAETIAEMRALFAELGLGNGPPSESVQRRLDELGILSIDLSIYGRGFSGHVALLMK